jgi:hypothetical protein
MFAVAALFVWLHATMAEHDRKTSPPVILDKQTAGPLDEPTKHPRRFTERSSTLTIVAGTGRITLPATESKEPVQMSSGGMEPFSARLCGGLLCIDADIYAGVDRRPIKVRNTEIIDRPADWDKNWDDKGVEIVNERGDPVFQLEYVDDSTASVKGLFLTSGTVVICDDSGAWRPTPVLALKRKPEKYSIAPLFKYPSKDFLGKRLPILKEDASFTKPSPDDIATQLKGFNSTPPADALKSLIGSKVKWRVWFAFRSWGVDERRGRDDTTDDFLFTTGTNSAAAAILVPTGKDRTDRSGDLVALSPYIVEGSIEYIAITVFHTMRTTKIWLNANAVIRSEAVKEQFTP